MFKFIIDVFKLYFMPSITLNVKNNIFYEGIDEISKRQDFSASNI